METLKQMQSPTTCHGLPNLAFTTLRLDTGQGVAPRPLLHVLKIPREPCPVRDKGWSLAQQALNPNEDICLSPRVLIPRIP